MKKFIFLFIAINIFLISGCSDDYNSNPVINTTDFDRYWELHIGNDSLLTHHYALDIVVTNGQLTGTIEIIDSTSRHNGTLAGTVTGSDVLVNADFPADDHFDFRFQGTKADFIIAGKLFFINAPRTGTDTFDVALVNSFNQALNFGDPAVPNPYLFETVFTTPAPTGPPVIFVHGMGSTLAAWDSMLANLDDGFKSRHNVYRYQYNWQDSVMINGRKLKEFVDSYELVDPIIVAHSMGGLVSRAYVASGGQITKLVTLGTPHLGSALANILFIRSDLNTPGPGDMKPDGPFITGMVTNALDVANRNKYFCIAGRMGGHFETTPPYQWVWNEPYYKDLMNGVVCTGWKLLLNYGPNDGLVNESSSLFVSGGVNLVFPTPQLYIDHNHLVHPSVAPTILNYINSL